MTKPKIVLVTGVTGTLGKAILRKILEETDYHVLGLSRDEQKQRTLPKHERARYRLADIRDIDSLYRACNCPIDLVFHLAALKCVDTLEDNPYESVKTNVLGTQNVLDVASNFGARVCFTSTDKAVYPINAYGQSKALAEKLVLAADPQNVVVRYGNVLGSRGSFLKTIIDNLQAGRSIPLTHDHMTRFWMPVDVVRDFVFEVALNDVVTGIMTPKDIKASYVKDLIHSVARILGKSKEDYSIGLVGMRPGEKLYEHLLNKYESPERRTISTEDNNLRFTDKELDDLLKPIVGEICASAS